MKRSITLLVIVLVAAMAVATQAQDRKSLRINEVMIVNDTSIVDDYGEHHAWIELFNANFAPLEISSMYLTNDKNNPTKYPIPLGDVKTRISNASMSYFGPITITIRELSIRVSLTYKDRTIGLDCMIATARPLLTR